MRLFARTHARGWSESEADCAQIEQDELAQRDTPNVKRFLVIVENTAVASAIVSFHNGIEYLAMISTVPQFRRQGYNQRLIQHIISQAGAMGAELITANTFFGEQSERNLQRAGFRIAFQSIVWTDSTYWEG